MQIWKFPIEFTHEQDIYLPVLFDPLHVDIQGGVLCLWALIDPNVMKKDFRKIYVIGTGHEVPENVDHLGTVLVGAFVWHVFIEKAR